MFDDLKKLFLEHKDAQDKAWGAMHDFFNDVLCYMEEHRITKEDIAKKLGKSKGYVTKAFLYYNSKTSIARFAEIAHALGLELKLTIDKGE